MSFDPFAEFFIPGAFQSPDAGDGYATALHLAGIGEPEIEADVNDVFGNDQTIGRDTERMQGREHLPQFGPPFVQFVHARFSRLDAFMEKALAKWSYEPQTILFTASVQPSATGGVSRNVQGNAMLYETEPGWTFALHRLTAFNVGNTFGAPFNAAGAYWELRVNDEMIDGASLVAPAAGITGGSLPFVKTWGTRDAPHIRDGEVLSFFMSAGPTGAVTIKGQGTLERNPEA